MTDTITALDEVGAARADLLRYLSACFYEPTPMFAEERMFEAMQAAATRVDPALGDQARQLGQAFEADDLQTLLVDYTRLFLGPVDARARPYGSVWQTGESTLMQDTTMALLALYRDAGFEMDESFRDLPDHIAVQLECLYALAFRRLDARRQGDAQAEAQCAVLERRLLDEHLGTWVGRFTQAMAKGAQTGFYRTLAGLTQQVAGG